MDKLKTNKCNVIAFYEMMFNECRPHVLKNLPPGA